MSLCLIEGCNNGSRAKGYCGKHYKQWRKGRLGQAASRDGHQGCRVAGCQGNHEAKGFCSKHYKRWRRGTIGLDGTALKRKQKCRVANCQDARYIGAYCEQHYSRLILMKDLWLHRVLPTHSRLKMVGVQGETSSSREVRIEDIRRGLDYDYTGKDYEDY